MLLRLCFMCITVVSYVLLNIELSLLKGIHVLEIVLKILVIRKYGDIADIFRNLW
jgi:hypothetical protein